MKEVTTIRLSSNGDLYSDASIKETYKQDGEEKLFGFKVSCQQIPCARSAQRRGCSLLCPFASLRLTNRKQVNFHDKKPDDKAVVLTIACCTKAVEIFTPVEGFSAL